MVVRPITRVAVKTNVGEGFFDGIGIGAPGPFMADVGGAEKISEHPGFGWQGKVIEGHEAFVGKRVVLRRRHRAQDSEGKRFPKEFGMGLGIVAYIYDTDHNVGGETIFSGICFAKVIEQIR